MSDQDSSRDDDSVVAVVGMSGRFPGADDVERFWANLVAGVQGIRDISDEELMAAGVDPALLADPRYVRRGAPLNDIEHFDAAFFGFSPREAEVTDPQHRLFLECSWEALEIAGYQPNKVPGRVGVFSGCGLSKYGFANVRTRPDIMATTPEVQWAVGNNSDSLSNTVSYKLGLTGPAVAVQSFCSTSLVAVHLGIQSLLTYDSDVALAGGASLEVPQATGYVYEEGGIVSADGTVRSFDADAAGSVIGNGVGVVVMKRLSDAKRDGDHVYAVVLGSASNNDGRNKAGFTAPGSDGQTDVIAYAHEVADVEPSTIGYVECHATGTNLGDSVELAAMDRAFADHDGATPTVLASLKPSVGHLDRASGVAGLIRASLAVDRALLPGTRNYRNPNPALAAAGAKFTVLTENQPWERGAHPRRAGVSSFGLGGTNAHVVIEEAEREERPAQPGPHALVLSARTAEALDAAAEALRGYLVDTPDADLADVAFTLQASRTGFTNRLAVIAGDVAEAVAALADPELIRRATPNATSSAAEAVIATSANAAVEQWLSGVEIDWSTLHDGHRRRVALPTYPFQRKRYWIEPGAGLTAVAAVPASGMVAEAGASPERDLATWFYHPVWHNRPTQRRDVAAAERGPWWVLAADELGERTAQRLAEHGADTVLIRPGDGYRHVSAEDHLHIIEVEPNSRCDYTRVMSEFGRPRTAVHAWTLGADGFDEAQRLGFHAVRVAAGALAETNTPGPLELVLVTGGAVEAVGGDVHHPEHATMVGLVPVLAQEIPDFGCRLVDVDVASCAAERGLDDLAAELIAEACTPIRDHVALRRADRWVQAYDQLRIDEATESPLRHGATVLITGGLGDVGAVLAEHLATTRGARLVLTVRTALPPENTWATYLADHPESDRAARHIRTVQGMRARGAEVLALSADVAERDQMAAVVAEATARFGAVDLVIHGAGCSDHRTFGPAPSVSFASCDAHFRPKIDGIRVLDEVLPDAPLRMTVSSLSSVLGGLGFSAYACANSGMDGYARPAAAASVGRPGGRWISVNWEGWGLRDEAEHPMPATTIKEYWMHENEGVEIFERALSVANRVRQLVISSGPLAPRLAAWTGAGSDLGSAEEQQARHERPALSTPYEEPAPGHETAVAEIWGEVLGIDKVGANDNFFELGGHSLTAVRLMGRIRTTYGGVPITAVIENPTVRELSTVLGAVNQAQLAS
ncbi:MAG: SDR family NAD(P)-dependent oxidoreductase [Actinophytocola sp.]|uniref:SDR family NAD(P)-dependent oxidoreductase n=1 Tax=Actinophytocola sp. TaxID=1872138 RepID=UPI001327017C|nr:SDR family NAD(P)-dependent oxidoreductase [Actinophytocola sp.]MPZ81182.1 SDR family NAD(P)-dependent oxidoreductase [Actinophytocola sp.]